MTISRRIELILLLTGMAWTVVVAAVIFAGSHRGFAALERDEAGKSVSRCVDAIASEHEHIGNTAKDWAYWDETHSYVSGTNDDFVADNLADDTFRNLDIDFLYILNSDDHVVYGQTFAGGDQAPREVFQPGQLGTDHPLVSGVRAEQSISGVVAGPGGILLVSACQILRSTMEGPSAGTLIMGRVLDRDRVDAFARQTHVDFAVVALPSNSLPARIAEFAASAREGEIMYGPRGEILDAYRIVMGVDGTPAILVDADIPRDITARGRASAALMAGGMLVLLFAVLLIVRTALNRQIVRPIVGLTKRVCEVDTAASTAEYPLDHASGEIAILRDEFSRMITRLREHEDQLVKRNADLTHAIEEINVLQGILPICACCKKIRDDKGYWGAVESYFSDRSMIRFSHGYCPECLKVELAKFGGKPEQAVDN